MPCAELPKLDAYVDNELDTSSHVDMERHINSCQECRAQLTELADQRALIRKSFGSEVARPQLHKRIERALDAEQHTEEMQNRPARQTWRLPPFWVGAASGFSAAALSLVAVFMFINARVTNPLLDEMVAAHLQSLQPGHLIAVESTDRHTVKPWFAGRADVSPVVADFAAQGYQLVGGRIDSIAQQRAAVLVYQHGRHVINVFSWAATQSVLPDGTRNGYHITCWQVGNLENCAMSDTGWDELRGLQRLLYERQIDEENNLGSH